MIIKTFLIWRLGLFIITFLGSKIFPLIPNGGIGAVGPNKDFDYLSSWAQWDGGHYVSIIENGYKGEDVVFFPLFPLLVKAISPIFFDNTLLAGLILSNFFFLLFLQIFFSFLKKKYGKKIAYTTVITYLLFPTSYFAVALYSESTLLLLTALFLFFLQSKKLLFASISVSLASISRLVGIFLLIPLIAPTLKDIQKNPQKKLFKSAYLFIASSGLILYGMFLYFRYGDALGFFTQQESWNRSIVGPINTFYIFFSGNIFQKTFQEYLDLFTIISFIGILIFGAKKIPLSWLIYSILIILVPVSTGTLTSMPRYVLAAFPLFIIIGKYLSSRRNTSLLVWGIFICLQITLSIMFINGYWTS